MAVVSHPLLPPNWAVPEKFKERLGAIAGKQRAMHSEGHLLLILHELPDPETHERRAQFFWRAPDGSWKATTGIAGSRAVAEHLQKYADRVDQLENDEEDARRAADFFVLLQSIVPLHRAMRNMHGALQQARDAVPHDREIIHFRDQAGELERSLELLHADVQNGLNYTVAHQAEEQSRRSNEMAIAAHRLNILAAIFFPVGAVATAFGMNLTHGYEQWQAPWTFWAVLGVSLTAGLLLAAMIVRPGGPRPSIPHPLDASSATLRRPTPRGAKKRTK